MVPPKLPIGLFPPPFVSPSFHKRNHPQKYNFSLLKTRVFSPFKTNLLPQNASSEFGIKGGGLSSRQEEHGFAMDPTPILFFWKSPFFMKDSFSLFLRESIFFVLKKNQSQFFLKWRKCDVLRKKYCGPK